MIMFILYKLMLGSCVFMYTYDSNTVTPTFLYIHYLQTLYIPAM